MPQPKDPPLSVRIPADLLAAIDAVANLRGWTRHATILAAAEAGVVMLGTAAKPAEPPKRAAVTSAPPKAAPAPSKPKPAQRRIRGFDAVTGEPIY